MSVGSVPHLTCIGCHRCLPKSGPAGDHTECSLRDCSARGQWPCQPEAGSASANMGTPRARRTCTSPALAVTESAVPASARVTAVSPRAVLPLVTLSAASVAARKEAVAVSAPSTERASQHGRTKGEAALKFTCTGCHGQRRSRGRARHNRLPEQRPAGGCIDGGVRGCATRSDRKNIMEAQSSKVRHRLQALWCWLTCICCHR